MSKKVDPAEMLALAESWRRATHVIDQRVPYELRIGIVSATVAAFTLELFLKSLIALEKGDYPRNAHNHECLFEHLKKSTKKRIRSIYDAQVGQQREVRTAVESYIGALSLDRSLQLSGDAFVKMRYAFEKRDITFTSGPIIGAVRDYIIETYPELRHTLV